MFYLILINLLFSSFTYAQTLVEDIDSSSDNVPSGLATEKIKMISPTKRVFVITNDNNSFEKGDFISLIKNAKIVARAIVAKVKDGDSGIKIIRIHSLNEWNKLALGSEVQILRGDDSYFTAKKKNSEENKEQTKIEVEEDLYSESKIVDDNLELDENKNRAIKTDNIVSVSYGQIEGIDSEGSSTKYSQFMGQYAYQVADNIWGEALYGQSIAKNFPSSGLDTKITNLTLRAKYTIAAPLYTYVQPYAGFQMINADSPGAGVADPSNTSVTAADLEREEALVANTKKNSFAFGITLLKRMVPGWFMRADLGSDIMNIGFSLEF
jgi:hypothetical protein